MLFLYPIHIGNPGQSFVLSSIFPPTILNGSSGIPVVITTWISISVNHAVACTITSSDHSLSFFRLLQWSSHDMLSTCPCPSVLNVSFISRIFGCLDVVANSAILDFNTRCLSDFRTFRISRVLSFSCCLISGLSSCCTTARTQQLPSPCVASSSLRGRPHLWIALVNSSAIMGTCCLLSLT